MANECIFCHQRHIPTNLLVLNQGEAWVEFCEPCGERETLTNEQTGETITVRALYDRCAAQAASEAATVNEGA